MDRKPKKSIEQIISEFSILHNNKYDYSLVTSSKQHDKIKIICREHGVFEQRIASHYKSVGCKLCKREQIRKKEELNFLKKAPSIHNNKYDYSKVVYKKSQIQIEIICPLHGNFWQTPNEHLMGYGCQICGRLKCDANRRYTPKEYLEKITPIYDEIFDLSQVKYVDYNTPIKVKCPIHGEFLVKPFTFLKNGCKKCNIERRIKIQKLTTQDFIERARKIHFNRYDYSITSYTTAIDKVNYICPTHGVIEQKAISHLLGFGCRFCHESKGELQIKNFLDMLGIYYERQKKFKACQYKTHLPFDFYVPEYNLFIEFNGEQHYRYHLHWHREENSFEEQQKRDTIKKEFATQQGIFLEIRYDDNVEEKLTKVFSLVRKDLS